MQVALTALLTSQEASTLSANFAGMVERLSSSSLGGARTSVLAQLDGQAALVDSNNRQLARLDLERSGAVMPQVRAGPGAGLVLPALLLLGLVAQVLSLLLRLPSGRGFLGDASAGCICCSAVAFQPSWSRRRLLRCGRWP